MAWALGLALLTITLAGANAAAATYLPLGELYMPRGVAVDPWTGVIYSGDSDGNLCRVLSVNATGIPDILAGGSGRCATTGDGGSARNAEVDPTEHLAVDESGNVYASSGYTVRRISASTRTITAWAGNQEFRCLIESEHIARVRAIAAEVSFYPTGMAVNPTSGHLFIADACSDAIWEIDETGVIVAEYGESPNLALGELAFDAAGNLYFVSGEYLSQIRKLDTRGNFSLVAGNGILGHSGNGGPATLAAIQEVQGIAVDSRGVLYLATQDLYIRQVNARGIISDVAGFPWPRGAYPAPPGSPARISAFFGIGQLAVDADDNLYVSDIGDRTLLTLSGPAEPESTIGWILHERIGALAGERHGGGNPSENSCDRGCVGDPVNTASGEYWETQTDLTIPGRGPALSFERSYSSQSTVNGSLGRGWTGAYLMSLDPGSPEELVTITQENGSTIAFEPNGSGGYVAPSAYLATLVANRDGTWTLTRRQRDRFVFDAEGRLISEADLNGETTTLAYDEAGKLTTITDPAGRTIRLAYEGSGRIRSLADSAGRTVSYEYTSGDLTSVVDARGERWIYDYDGAHRLTRRIDPNGHVDVANTYDSADRVTAQADGAEHVTQFSYGLGRTEITSPERRVRRDWYASGQLIRRDEAVGTANAATWEYEYDPDTHGTTRVTDPNGHVWRSTYDAAGRRTSTTDPLEHFTTTEYDELGDPVTSVDADGVTTTSTFDERGNLLSTSTPLSGTEESKVTRYVHGTEAHPGDVTAIVDPREKTTEMRYDGNGYATSITDPLGNQTTMSYDAAGNLRTVVSPRGNEARGRPEAHTATYVRDAAGTLTQLTDPLRHVTRWAYDAAGNLESKTDAKGQVTSYDYDAGDLPTTVHRADRTTLRRSYDADGNLTETDDGAGHATRYAYDGLGRLSTATDPARRTTAFHYDAAGNMTSMDDPQARTTRYAYDNANRPRTITYSDRVTPTVTFGYDAAGQRTSMRDGSGTSTYEYDTLHRLVEHTDGAGRVVRYGYDLANELTRLTYPSGRTVERTYDDAGRLASVTDWLEGTTRYAYDADSNLVTTTFPAASEEVDTSIYDEANELTSSTFSKGASTLARLVYTRDEAGLPTQLEQTGLPGSATARSTYTALNQLATHDGRSYEYDAADDLTNIAGARPLAYDAANQLTEGPVSPGSAVTPATFAYDLDGNRTSATPERGTATRYSYDQADRLVRHVPATGSSTTYVYDGDGLRTKKTVGTTATRFAWDRSDSLPLLLSDAANSYVYGPDGLPLEQINGSGTVTYYHHDEIGSTRLLTSSSGATNATFTYDPYGTLAARTGTQTTPLGFAGQYTDAESGLQYLRARYYDPATGQFLTRDPLTASSGQPYGYAGGNPLAATDPSGLFAINLADIGMFMSDAAAGALNELTFGLSNQIAGVDGSCAGSGYFWGRGLGFGGSFFTGGGEGRILFNVDRVGADAARGIRGGEHGLDVLGFDLRERNYVSRVNPKMSVHVDLHPTRHGGAHLDIHIQGPQRKIRHPLGEPIQFPG